MEELMKNFKNFIKENIDTYTIPLKPSEIKHFNVAMELNDKIKKKFGYEMALVGGACRDLFMRKFFGEEKTKEINDLDFAIYKSNTNGLNDKELTEIMNFINLDYDFSVVDEIKFLHLKVIHKPTGYEIEYTSTRKEAYRDNTRKPETQTGDILTDILRRDFTVNAIYLNIIKIDSNNIYVQPANDVIKKHIDDVRNKILKTTTENPEDVFNEDPLRVLRAVRFAGYGYDMEPKLDKTIQNFDNTVLLSKVSKERIADELGKILEKGNVDYLIKSGFITKIMSEFSEFDDKEYKDNELQHIVDVIKVAREKAPTGKKLLFLLSALFHDIGKGSTGTFSDKKERWQFLGHEEKSAEIAKKIMSNYKFSSDMIRDVSNLVSQHMVTKFFDKVPEKTIIKWILVYDNQQKYPDLIENVLLFNTIDWGGKSSKWRDEHKEMIQNERVIADKVIKLRDKIRIIKNKYKDELKEISTEIGKDKHIPATSKSGAILKRHANFILGKMKES